MNRPRYVYAIINRRAALPTVNSVHELSVVPWRELAAVTAPTTDDRAAVTMEAVLHHEAVVEAVRLHCPALPVRFGTVFRDAASVASALAERYESLAADLERVGDKVELSVIALWAADQVGDLIADPDDDPVGRTAGGRYLHARAAQLRRDEVLRKMAQAVARQFDDVLGGLALERRVSLVPTARVAVRTAYLLDSAEVGAFRDGFESIRGTRSDLRVLLTGPWPPYSFVRRTTEGAGDSDNRLTALVQWLTDTMRNG